MDKRPSGRDRNVTGQGKDVYKRGNGLGTGPVGRKSGYSGRGFGGGSGGGGNGGGGTRGGGGSSLIWIIIAVVVLLGGGGFGISNLFGGSDEGGGLTSLFSGSGWTGTASSTSTAWVQKANTGVLDTSVAPGAREKRVDTASAQSATVMVYLCGTDLESKYGMGTADVKEMCGATLSGNVNLLLYTGGCKAWKNNTFSNSVNQIYKIEKGSPKCLVKDDGNGAMTDPATLTRFIRYCAANYPADRNILILWDHGAGALSGYGYDERNASSGSMNLKGIDTALKNGGVTFDLVGFDACLMATYENALMLEKHADYLLASEETEPGVGWYYKNWLTNLSKNPAISTLEIGKTVADDFTKFCEDNAPGQKTTLSLIDLAELAAATPAQFNDFAKETASLVQSDDYQKVSDARAATREFGSSSKVDQVDLAHLAYNLGTAEAKELASAVLGAVKYNRTSPNVTNAFGLSIYFPYQKTSKVTAAVKTYEELGLDEDYADCIRSFASLEAAGQQMGGGDSSSPLASLLGNFTGQSALSSGGVSDLFSSLLSGGSLFGGALDSGRASAFLTDHQFESANLKWVESDGRYVMRLEDEQWALVQELQLNVFYDDGEGYIDLGLDVIYDFTENGELIGEYDGAWMAIDDQPVPCYHEESYFENGVKCFRYRVPILLNGERADLILVFDRAHPNGAIVGARPVYAEGETQTAAKEITSLSKGDRIEYVCDYYSYDGAYQDSYLYAEAWEWTGEHTVSDVYLPNAENASAIYLFTDIYNQEHWSEVLPD